MKTREGSIDIEDGELDLKLSMECGQTFLWNKLSGKPLHEDTPCKKFYKVLKDNIVILWQDSGKLYYRGSVGKKKIIDLLNLDVDLKKVEKMVSMDHTIVKAFQKFRGLRILNDEFFPCLISYIISAQTQIPRIKFIVDILSERYGSCLNFGDNIYNKFPTPLELSKATLGELKEIGLGYRAKYVKTATDQIVNSDIDEEYLKNLSYPEAKGELKKLMGVGDKVADCVLLFSLGFDQSYPLDTWGKKVIREVYPDFYDTRYWKVSENMRNYFGKYAGWAHEYLFHWARENREIFG
ncbi:MAG: DNA glycosylase [Candidatus Aenigmatarchaeota archaeon]